MLTLNMKVKDLSRSLDVVAGVVNARHLISILQNAMLLQAENGDILVVGSDGEVEIETTLHDVKPEGDIACLPILFPIDKVMGILSLLSREAEIALEFTADRLHISAQGSTYDLNTFNAQDYPRIGLRTDEESYMQWDVPMLELANGVERAVHAMAQNDIRRYLNGLFFELREGLFNIVATDGHRLVWTKLEGDYPVKNTEDTLGYILPRRSVMELKKLFGGAKIEEDAEGETAMFTLETTDKALQIALPQARFLTKLVNAQYPNYRGVVPPQSDKYIKADVQELLSKVKQASVVGETLGNTGVHFEIENGRLNCSAHNSHNEKSKVSMGIETNIDAHEITFNAGYLRDIFMAMKTTDCTILIDPTLENNGVLMLEQKEGESAPTQVADKVSFVLMPMNA